jgi:hypothetical protein
MKNFNIRLSPISFITDIGLSLLWRRSTDIETILALAGRGGCGGTLRGNASLRKSRSSKSIENRLNTT